MMWKMRKKRGIINKYNRLRMGYRPREERWDVQVMQKRNRQMNSFCSRDRSARKGLVRLSAAVVVFSTALMMATPAFALDLKDKVLHTHNEFCRNVEGTLICPLMELVEHEHSDCCYETAAQGHIHEDACCTTERGALICVEATQEAHIHTDTCYEAVVHQHASDCYVRQQCELTCALSEQEDHAHGDDCYEWTEVLSCSRDTEPVQVLICTEDAQHVHGDACYEWTKTLTCGMEELPDDATEPEQTLVCTRMELKNHIHSAQCYKSGQLGKGKLTCKLPQLNTHQHILECLDFTDAELICEEQESAEHQHDHLCYRSWKFLCQIKKEAPKSDPAADVETPEIWEKTFAHVKLTGAWTHDMLAIAQTQLGYEESDRNFVYDNGVKKGYTRYGDWYGGVQYGDWCAMFIAFCMHYAGVQGVPFSCSCDRWTDFLDEAGMYVSAEGYTPKTGDLVFFDSGRTLVTPETAPIAADHVAIVTELIPATESEPAAVVTLEGNYYDCVRYETRYLDDPKIIGYAQIPDGPGENYSCGLKAHAHGDGCYEAETLTCKIRAHTHGGACCVHDLRYEDASVKVEVTLSNVTYLPADLSLRAVLVPEEEAAASAMMAAVVKKTASARSRLLCQLRLISDGQIFDLPMGARADVQVTFKQPVFTAKATLKKAQLRTFLLTEEMSEDNAVTYQAQELTDVRYQKDSGGVVGVSFTAKGVSAFSVTMDLPGFMTLQKLLKRERLN